jgi:hypothetical protein
MAFIPVVVTVARVFDAALARTLAQSPLPFLLAGRQRSAFFVEISGGDSCAGLSGEKKRRL